MAEQASEAASGTASEESGQAAKTPTGAASAGAIVVVDPDPISRGLAEDLEDDLDRQMIAMDSMDFEPEASEDVIEASAFIICWNLEIRSGADLLEQVRSDPVLGDRIVLIAMDAPSRASVRTAMSLGADGVCLRPYEADEIAALLARAESGRIAQAA